MILRVILGAVLAAMALGQFASFDAMSAILATYHLTSGATSTALAVSLIGSEAVTAAGTYAAQPLRWYILAEDTLMLLYAWLLWRGLRRARAPSHSAETAFTTARTQQENH